MTTTWNPSDKWTNITLSDSNHAAASAPVDNGAVRGQTSHNSGKWYLEFSVISFTNAGRLGVALSTQSLNHASGGTGEDFDVGIDAAGNLDFQAFSPTWGTPTGHTVGMAIDITNGKYWFTYNGTTWNVGNTGTPDPATDVGGVTWDSVRVPKLSTLFPYTWLQAIAGTPTATINCGDRAFAYTVPTGFTGWDVPIPPVIPPNIILIQ